MAARVDPVSGELTVQVKFSHGDERLKVSVFSATTETPLVLIDGNAAALMRLRDMIDNALRRGHATAECSGGASLGFRHKELFHNDESAPA